MNTIFNKIERQYDDYPINSHISVIRRLYDFLLYYFNFLALNKPAKVIFNICCKYDLKRKKILDMGSFTGYNSFYFSCKKNMVTGVELSNKIEYAKRRYHSYNINFVKGNVFYFIAKESLASYDFIFCCNLPIHYDNGKMLESKLSIEFFDNLYQNLNSKTTFYYLFYSTKHNKVGFPVEKQDLELMMKDKPSTDWNVSEKIVYDYPMVELVIKKNHAK